MLATLLLWVVLVLFIKKKKKKKKKNTCTKYKNVINNRDKCNW